MDLEQAWRVAEMRWWANHLSTFLAARTDDPDRAAEIRLACDRVFAADPSRPDEVMAAVAVVNRWMDEMDMAPDEPRPVRHDLSVRDHVKDVLFGRSAYDTRAWLRDAFSFLDLALRRIVARPELDAQTREDAYYLYGRACMAAELGDRAAYDKELERLELLSEPAG